LTKKKFEGTTKKREVTNREDNVETVTREEIIERREFRKTRYN
jgi:hypothetical protein